MQAVIMAGGLGTRLGPLTREVPKPLVLVNGVPFMELELRHLRENGVDEIVICVGYLGELVETTIGDGTRFGLTARYSFDGPELLGVAGALKNAERLLRDTFLVTYGDSFLTLDYRALMERLSRSKALGVMAVYRNEGRHGRSDVDVRGGRVVAYDKGGERKLRWINFGVTALKKQALVRVPRGRVCGEEEFYGRMISRRELLAFPVKKRFYEIGTPESLREFEKFAAKNGLTV
jgi:NDP-sugar pyrophosphorylase family protein